VCLTGRLRLNCDGTRAETKFRLSAKRTSPFKTAGGVSSVDCWQASCAHQPAEFVLLVRACVLLSRDACWLPTPFSCFPFTSPPVHHRVPSHFNWTLPHGITQAGTRNSVSGDVHGSVHHNTYLIEMINKKQLCRTVYYSIVLWLLNMFQKILSLIIRSV
jgi:hypothetical protein